MLSTPPSTGADVPYKPLTRKEMRALGEEVVASVRDGSGGYCELLDVTYASKPPRTPEEVQEIYKKGLRIIFGS